MPPLEAAGPAGIAGHEGCEGLGPVLCVRWVESKVTAEGEGQDEGTAWEGLAWEAAIAQH